MGIETEMNATKSKGRKAPKMLISSMPNTIQTGQNDARRPLIFGSAISP